MGTTKLAHIVLRCTAREGGEQCTGKVRYYDYKLHNRAICPAHLPAYLAAREKLIAQFESERRAARRRLDPGPLPVDY